jgi:hypothetical protein
MASAQGRQPTPFPRRYRQPSRDSPTHAAAGNPTPTETAVELSPRRGRQPNIDSPTHAEADNPTETAQHRELTPRPTTQQRQPNTVPVPAESSAGTDIPIGALQLARSEGWQEGWRIGAQQTDRWQLGWSAGYEYGWRLGWVEGRRLMAQAYAALPLTTPQAVAYNYQQPTTSAAATLVAGSTNNIQPDEEPPHDNAWSNYRANEWTTAAVEQWASAALTDDPAETAQRRQPNTDSSAHAETCTAEWRQRQWVCFDERCTYCRCSSGRIRLWSRTGRML